MMFPCRLPVVSIFCQTYATGLIPPFCKAIAFVSKQCISFVKIHISGLILGFLDCMEQRCANLIDLLTVGVRQIHPAGNAKPFTSWFS